MNRPASRPLSEILGPRSWFMLGVIVAYLVLAPVAIFGLNPGQPTVEATPLDSTVGPVLQSLEHLPYAGQVRNYMETRSFPEPEIAAKIHFLAHAYLIMFTGYAAALLLTVLVFLVWGPRTDFFAEVLSMFGRDAGRTYRILLGVLFAGDAFLTWVGIDGFLPFPRHGFKGEDHIATSNLAIMTVVLFMGLSLLATMIIVRLSLCAVYAVRHAPDVEPYLPSKSMPVMDPTPEVETW